MLRTVMALYCYNTPSWDNTSASLEIWNISCKTVLMAVISAKSTASFMSLATLLGKCGTFRKGSLQNYGSVEMMEMLLVKNLA